MITIIDDPTDQGDRSLENIPLRIPIEERERREHGHKGAGQRNRAQELPELPGENL
jgi:hypothetical protein